MRAALWAVAALGALVAAGNLAILAAHLRARLRSPRVAAEWGRGVENPHETTPLIWRSGRPNAGTYEAVASAGVRVVIDLRAEGGAEPDPGLGLEHVRLPVHDGRAPDPETIDAFRRAVDAAQGAVLVHCSAGVGRTGSLVAARLVLDEGWSSRDALQEVLSVGPPSLEQIDFVLGLPERIRPRVIAVVISRVLDAPRRTWSQLKTFLKPRPVAGSR